MAHKPLDGAFSNSSTETKKKKRGAFVAIAAVVGLAGISSVFAANVEINGGSEISFSQGTTTIAPCDADGVTVDLGAFYAADSEAFELDTVTLSDVSAGCSGLTLTLELYDGISKLVTATGTITDTTVVIGQADVALADYTATSTGISNGATTGEAAVDYEVGSTAAGLASFADRIVIEIN